MRLMGVSRLSVFIGSVGIAMAQSSAAIDDLERRAIDASQSVRRAETWSEVLNSRDSIRTKLIQSLDWERAVAGGAHEGFLYLPKDPKGPVPAVVLLRPHDDVMGLQSRLLPAAVAQMGVAVFELDTGKHRSRLDQFVEGSVPQSFIQQGVQRVVRYLRTRSDVDAQRLGLVGDGLAATVAAGINHEFSTVVLLNGGPDFKSVIRRLRSSGSDRLSDPCELIPGILQYAGTEELLTLIAPRPLLLIGAEDAPLQYATDLYRWSGGVQKLQHRTETAWTPAARVATYAWLSKWLMDQAEFVQFRESNEYPEPIRVNLPEAHPPQTVLKSQLSERVLGSLLGEPLPQGPMTYALNCHGDHRVDFYPQQGLKIPVTVIRPGPEGCDPSRGDLIAVDDNGRAVLTDDPIVREAGRRGWNVWMIDPRGIGELKTNSESFVFAVSLLLGENFAWRQSADILGILRSVSGAHRDPVVLFARGKNMTLAAAYVAARAERNELSWVVLRDGARSFAEMREVPLSVIPFGALKWFDISDLWNSAKGRLLVIDRPEEFLQRDW